MELTIKNIRIATGDYLVALIHWKDAQREHLNQGDRITITSGRTTVVGVVDITKDEKILKQGKVGIFQELTKAGHFKTGAKAKVAYAQKPRSVYHIKKKLAGKQLNEHEINEIMDDISNSRLTDIELTYFVSAGYMQEFSNQEVTHMTKAMVANGQRLDFNAPVVMDKHCIGGVAGNRTTCVVVPMLAACGLTIPKTSSRSITSPAGTADTMEVLCSVSLTIPEMKKVVKKTNGCLVWGGAMSLAPADDKIIRVEHPMSLDPVGQLLTSILAKKYSVGATHVLIDIPFGKGAKIHDKKRALMLKDRFEKVGRKLGMNVKVVITDGTEPIGNGIGPALEAKDILWTLQNDPRGSHQLREKAIKLGGIMLEMGGVAKRGAGEMMATELLDNGKAYDAFCKMIIAQKGKKPDADKVKVGKYKRTIKANHKGVITEIHNANISAVAKLAGAPKDKGAGIYLNHHVGEIVEEDDELYTIYSESPAKLQQALREARKHSGITLKRR